jgi:hypothetical protein
MFDAIPQVWMNVASIWVCEWMCTFACVQCKPGDYGTRHRSIIDPLMQAHQSRCGFKWDWLLGAAAITLLLRAWIASQPCISNSTPLHMA